MVEESLRAMLHPTESLRVLLEAEITRPASLESKTMVDLAARAFDSKDMRVLAVIAHKDDRHASEEGSLFIYTTSTAQDDAIQNIELESVFPLTSDFSISLAQAVSGSRTPNPNETDIGFSLTIHPGRGSDPELQLKHVSFLTNDVKALRPFLTECRGLINTEENLTISQSNSKFLWLLPYTADLELPQPFGLIPQDLRLINQPLHTRLSLSLARLPGDDIADFRLIGDGWIRAKARETSTMGQYTLKIRVGTFNVNGKLPSQDLSSWVSRQTSMASPIGATLISPLEMTPIADSEFDKSLFGLKPSSPSKNDNTTTLTSATVDEMSNLAGPDPDLLVLGFQELDLSTEALIYLLGTAREDAWCRAVFAALGEKMGLYEKLASRQLVGILIVVIAKKALISCFSNVQTSMASTGIMGIMGNKGGVALRLTFTPPVLDLADVTSPGPTTLTFVNSHLAAFDEMVEKRNSDFHEISRKLKFDSGLSDMVGAAPVHVSVYESDVLFWMGDLNYRIDLPEEDIRGILASEGSQGRFKTLLRYDQLKKVSRSGKAFSGFYEHTIMHLPTYRFSPGIETNTLGYDVKRKPAWTDRILHRAGRNVSVRQLSYTYHPQITMSDHKPVAADFSLDVDVYDKNSRSDTCRKLFRTLARMEDYPNRVMKLDTTSVDFGFVCYKRTTSRALVLTNAGKGPCAYRFIPHAPDSVPHPEWLAIEPMQAILLPGESVQVTLTIHVDNATATKLNLGQKELRTTLILHTILGKDHFISVNAEYQRTCFANKLSWLTRLPGPVRSLNSLDDIRPEDQSTNAPREIIRLINWMMSGHVDDKMFASPGDDSVIDTIRECLDTGKEFPFSQADSDATVILSFGETLLRLLDSLVDPVVPVILHPKCAQITNRDEAFELLDIFPPVSVNVWISLTAFLHFLCQSNGRSSKRIATILAPILLRDELGSKIPPISVLGKQRFLLYFIA